LKLPASAGNAPAEPAMPAPAATSAPAATPPTEDLDFGGQSDIDTPTPEAPANDSPFEKEPFDAGIDVDEESDPKKFIEKLSGKIGQSLRDYTQKQGQPDFELEKFAINSLISATHTAEMDEQDRNDIIKKINKSGENDSQDSGMDNNANDENNGDDSNNGSGFDLNSDSQDGMDENALFEEESIFLKQPKRVSIFAPEGSPEFMEQNRIAENKPCWSGYEQIGMKKKNGKEVPNCVPINEQDLTLNEKMTIFNKDVLKSKLQETFNQESMSEPLVEPIVKPTTKPAEPAPKRRDKPFTIEPDTVPVPPKALKESFGGEDEYEFNEKHNQAITDSKKQLNIKGLDEMKDLIDYDNERLKAIVHGIRKEIANMEIQNNVIAATDNMDTVWIFNVLRIDNKVYLEFNGTAK
jgi:hypothetical protein